MRMVRVLEDGVPVAGVARKRGEEVAVTEWQGRDLVAEGRAAWIDDDLPDELYEKEEEVDIDHLEALKYHDYEDGTDGLLARRKVVEEEVEEVEAESESAAACINILEEHWNTYTEFYDPEAELPEE